MVLLECQWKCIKAMKMVWDWTSGICDSVLCHSCDWRVKWSQVKWHCLHDNHKTTGAPCATRHKTTETALVRQNGISSATGDMGWGRETRTGTLYRTRPGGSGKGCTPFHLPRSTICCWVRMPPQSPSYHMLQTALPTHQGWRQREDWSALPAQAPLALGSPRELWGGDAEKQASTGAMPFCGNLVPVIRAALGNGPTQAPHHIYAPKPKPSRVRVASRSNLSTRKCKGCAGKGGQPSAGVSSSIENLKLTFISWLPKENPVNV